MTIHRNGVMGIALASAITAACASAAPGAAEPQGQRGSQTMVEVTNNNWLDINVYAVWSGTRTRLGTVTSRSTGAFALPATMVATGAVQLMAAPIGSQRSHRTDTIMVTGGEQIMWNVEESLPHSSYLVRTARR